MDPQKVKAVRSASMPVVYPWVRQLVELLDADLSANTPRSWVYEHCMQVIFDALKASKLLEESEYEPANIDSMDFLRIFHQLSRPFLRSILLNTVGMDFYNESLKKKNYDQTYSMLEAGGAYVAAMFIDDHRDGKFLTAREILKLIEILRDYKVAVECFPRCVSGGQITSGTRRERRALLVAHQIDDTWNGQKSSVFEKPKLSNESSIQHLIGMLMLRYNAAEPQEMDVHQQQSPLMVGTTNKFQKHIWSHYPDEAFGSESNTATTWSLTWSCIRHMGLPVRVVCVPMFLACKNVDVNNGEILGTILAGSMLPGRGLNCKRPGNHRKDKPISAAMLEQIQDHVYVHGAWYTDNMGLSAMNQPLAPTNLNPKPDPVLEAKLNQLRQVTKGLEVELEAAQAAMEARKAAYDKWVKEKKEKIAFIDKLTAETEELTRWFREHGERKRRRIEKEKDDEEQNKQGHM